MRVLIWIIIIFALAVGLSMLAGQDWGYVQFMVPQWWRVQMSIKLFIVLLLIAFIAAYLLVRLIRNTLSLPEAVGQWRERRRRLRADRSLRDAVVALHEGRYARALKFAEKAFEASDYPDASILLAARAAHALRDDARYRDWIGRLKNEEEKVQAARLMTEAELAVISCDYEEAARKLEILQPDGRRNIAALRLSLRVSMALCRWDEALRLIRLLRKHKALTEEQAQPLLCRVHIERLRACAGDDDKNDALIEMWKAIPTAEREDRQLMLEAVPLFAHAGKGHVVRRTVERLLDAEWNTELARLYGLCGDIGACLSKGENWLLDHKEDPGLLFSLGRLCAELQLWGKAVEYLELSLRWQPEVETHLALANLFKRLERSEDEQKHYRAAAEMAVAC